MFVHPHISPEVLIQAVALRDIEDRAGDQGHV